MRGRIMGKVSGNWITGAHSGRACRHDDIYTKVNKKTGACYSVKLCNPNTNWSEAVLNHRNVFAAVSSALCAWIKAEKEKNSTDYQKVKKAFDRQIRFSTLRGMMYAKGMFTISEDGSVTVDITASTSTAGSTVVTPPSADSGSGGESGGSGNDNTDGGTEGGGGGLGEPEYS